MMEHRIAYFAGIAAGILLVAVVGLIFKKKTKTKNLGFDERQELARGRAFKKGFFALILYFFLYYVISVFVVIGPDENAAGIMIGICLSGVVFGADAIWHDAYFALHETPKHFVFLYLILMVVNLGFGISNVLEYGSASGRPIRLLNLCVGVMLLMFVIVYGAKNIRDKKIDAED